MDKALYPFAYCEISSAKINKQTNKLNKQINKQTHPSGWPHWLDSSVSISSFITYVIKFTSSFLRNCGLGHIYWRSPNGKLQFCPMLVMRGFFEQNQKFSLCYLSFPQPLPHLNVYAGHPIYSNWGEGKCILLLKISNTFNPLSSPWALKL